MTTPVRIWGPAFFNADFRWLRTFPPESVFTEFPGDDLSWCKLCEDRVERTELKGHAAAHLVEFETWKREQKAQQEMVA